MKKILLALTLAVTVVNAFGQLVTGTVYELDKDSNKIPLPGVNVYWLGGNSGTQTSSTGTYSLFRKQGFSKLVFSYIGYTSDTVLASNNTIDVVLAAGTKIQEVVVKSEGNSFYKKMETVQVQQIGTGELRKAACCNLSESFSTNASVDVNYTDAVSGAKQIELLGLSGKYGQIMIEKMPQVRGLSSNYGLSYIPGTWMDAIQVSKGTSSVVDGFESTTGQINVEFKKPSKGENFMLNMYGSENGKFEANSNIRFKLNDKWSTSVLAHGESYTNTHDMNDDGFIDMPGVQQYNLMNRWSYVQPSGLEAQFGIKALGERRWGGRIGFDGFKSSLNDTVYNFLVNTKRIEAFSKTGWVFKKEATSLGFINNISRIDQNSIYGHNHFDASQDNWYSNLIYESFIGNTFHKYTTGASFLYDNYHQQLNGLEIPKQEYTPGVFFQYTYTHSDKYVLMTGIRADHSNIYGTFFTPRFHFKYNFPNDMIVRLSVGKGYRSPNAIAENMSLLASSRQIIVSPDITMENAWNIGITASKGIMIGEKELHVYGEYFRTQFINQMITDLDVSATKAYIINNQNRPYSNNYQLELSMSPINRLDVLIAYRRSDVRAIYNGSLRQRPLVNTYKGLTTVSYFTNKKKWQIDLTTQFNGGGRLPDTYVNSKTNAVGGNFPAYTMLNSQLTKNFKKLSLYVGVENILNYRQPDPVLGANDPFGPNFDSSMIWGPLEGRMIYGGLRLTID